MTATAELTQSTYSNASPCEPLTVEKLNAVLDLLRGSAGPIKRSPRLHASPYLTERVQYSRSPSRAARRNRYPQHFAVRPCGSLLSVDGVNYYGHPAVIEALKREFPHA